VVNSEIIDAGLWSKREYSFKDIFDILKETGFAIEDGVDSAEVSAFVEWVESAEP
jgi:hypothetical protein